MTVIGVLLLNLLLQQTGIEEPPLPEFQPFLAEIKKHLRSDRLLLSQYTYTQTETERHLNKDGSVKKTEVIVSEVYPSLEEGLTYRRIISRDGKPLTREQVEKQDREHDRKLEKRRRKLEKEGAGERSRRLEREAKERREEAENIEEAFRLFEINMIGRELRGGMSTILFTFRPRPDYKPRTREAKFLKKIAGRAWFAEDSHELVRIEAELTDSFSIGLGMLARLQKGATAVFERRLVNGEVWLPASASFAGKGRLLLLKSLRIEDIQEFSDYRKFTVDTNVSFPSGESHRQPR